jgi:hypothetical protein
VASPSINGVATRPQVIAYIKQGMITWLKDSVRGYERKKAADAANVSPINPS